MNTKSNELIANFAGFQQTSVGWYDFEDVLDLPYTQDNTFDRLLFDKSWDWLMPVVEKIYLAQSLDLGYPTLETEEALIIRDNLAEANLTGTYEAVVQFINWRNENK